MMKTFFRLILTASVIFSVNTKAVFADDNVVQTIDIDTVEKLIADLETSIKFIEEQLEIQREQLGPLTDTASDARAYATASKTLELVGGVILTMDTYVLIEGSGILMTTMEDILLFPLEYVIEYTGAGCALKMLVIAPVTVSAFGAVLGSGPFLVAHSAIGTIGLFSDMKGAQVPLLPTNFETQETKNVVHIIGNDGSASFRVASAIDLQEYKQSVRNKYNKMREESETNYQAKLDAMKVPDICKFDLDLSFGSNNVEFTLTDINQTEAQITWYKVERAELAKLLAELKLIKKLLEKALRGDLEQPLNLNPENPEEIDAFYRLQAIDIETQRIREEGSEEQPAQEEDESEPELEGSDR